ncbi:MAG: hypothetical protein H6R26_914 [Proteobacteria bacterium]|nr:hypothetical protein [Pseudomonadota bacterium]
MLGSDPRFPHMADALNPAVMGPLLRETLRVSGPQGHEGVIVGEKRYKPGKSLVISYRIASKEAPTGQDHLATARLCPPGEARSEFERELERRPVLDQGALRFLHEPAMLLWTFPHDRKLIHLPRLLDAALLPLLLRPSLKVLGVEPARQIGSVASEVLHYLPERSCMIRYRVQCQNEFTGSDNSVLVYGKNYADDAGEEVFALMRQLRGQFNWGAQPLVYDGATRTLWQSHVPGLPLCWADLDASGGLAVAGRMGRCVATLHACTLDTATRFRQDDVEKALLQTIELADRTRPEFGPRISRAVAALLSHDQSWPEPSIAPIHHDLKLNNFLVDGNALGLIDMDCLCLGDPLADLAGLIANLYLNGLREGCHAGRIHPVVRAVVSAYRQANAHGVPLPRLRWHVAAALIHEVTRRSLRQLDERRMEHLPAYLKLSETFADLARKPEQDTDEVI